MFRYKNEAAFSRAVVKLLGEHGWFVQRIESGTTGRGVPDIYAIEIKTKQAIWIELKRIHREAGLKEVITWRPGQQAWLKNVVKYGQCAQTLCCFDNEIWIIPHATVYEKNVVSRAQASVITSLQELL